MRFLAWLHDNEHWAFLAALVFVTLLTCWGY